ncbi:hypothetical protein GCM10009865_01270 [Aeromicrobium ponti]|uniref:Putative AbgT family transporter n=1 Tax=Cytobacillus oceanisediminis TaxID=665099 RepID=A0A562K581_9BACI|nr:putative AbgT family transporter [Cytobacillus oceanisediminis]
MYHIGVVGPEQSVERILDVAKEFEKEMKFHPYTYKQAVETKEITQAALYRIGDSISNPITPMLPYLVLLLSFAKKYDKNMGLGTLISALFPYTIFFGIFWIILIVVWYLLGIPVGPEGPIHL